jgi:DNA transformation protein
MAKAPPAHVSALVLRLAPLGPVRARAMFGGHGLYLDDLMFALVAGGRLYLKTDAAIRHRFAAAGSQAFTYQGKSKTVETSYWLLPPDGESDPAAFVHWAELGLAAARAKRAATRPRRQQSI